MSTPEGVLTKATKVNSKLTQPASVEIPVGVLFPQIIALSLGPQHYILAPARAPALISKVYPGGVYPGGAGGWGGGGP